MNFLRNLLAAIIGCLIAFGIMFVMALVLVALIGGGEDTVVVKNNSVWKYNYKPRSAIMWGWTNPTLLRGFSV